MPPKNDFEINTLIEPHFCDTCAYEGKTMTRAWCELETDEVVTYFCKPHLKDWLRKREAYLYDPFVGVT